MPRTLTPNRSDSAYGQLREGILTGRWAANSRLSTYRLAEELGMSRTPIIEALKRLEADGLIEIVPQVGCRVLEGARDVGDVFMIRAAMESLAAEIAAGRITPRQLELLAVARDDAEHAVANEDVELYQDANLAFHLQIVRASGLSHLERLLDGLWTLNRYQITACGHVPESMQASVAEHRAIYDALATGRADDARRATETHLRRNGHAYRSRASNNAIAVA